jgi:hypothetical protein
MLVESSTACALGEGVAELDGVACITLELAAMEARCCSWMFAEWVLGLGTVMEVGAGAFTLGLVTKLEGLVMVVCTADCTGMGLMVTGAISMGIDSMTGVA